MNFKPGDKVWLDIAHHSVVPPGAYSSVIVRAPTSSEMAFIHPLWLNRSVGAWWIIDVEGLSKLALAPEAMLMRRDDPPEQQPQREEVGDWELCPWRPPSVPKEPA